MEEPIVIGEKTDRDPETGRFLPNNNANPTGRPKGRFSITTQIIRRLEENPDSLKEIIDWLLANRKDLVWNKIDPNPPQDLNLGGEVTVKKFIISDGSSEGTIISTPSDPASGFEG